ncbi:MAG TPA: SprT family zinc-dependent metalloprotease [Candidatus Saccharimonadaceae bacterium]|nr:SprT family zinc-dependent metalloprotease [Candidatus Saccharimonadaceae bacterium]
MPEITDSTFGVVTIRRSARARSVRIRVAPNGRLHVSAPPYTPIFVIKRLLKSSRTELQTMLEQSKPHVAYHTGQLIGKSHTLLIRESSVHTTQITHHGQQIIITIPADSSPNDAEIQRVIRDALIPALRKEAKSYLPRRLSYLAEQLGYQYEKVRFSHAAGRWGSCSSRGTISLNIALMKLPFELIDYVLIHELSHTREMNHSPAFWQLVELGDPDYKSHRKALRDETPAV